MIMLMCLVILLLFCCIFITLLSRHKKPPGPYGFPFIGCLTLIDPLKPYETFSRLARQYGTTYGLWMGQVYTVVLTDPTLIRTILSKDEATGRAPLFITHGIMGGHGIICAQGNLWRDQRRLSIDWLRKLGMVKYGCARLNLERRINSGLIEMLQDIDNMVDKAPQGLNPSPIIHHVLGNLLNDLVFGIKYEKNNVTWKYLQHLQEEGVKHIGVSMAVNFLPFLRYLPSTRRTINFLLSGKHQTHAIYDALISHQRSKLRSCDTFIEEQEECILTYFLKEAAKRQEAGRPDAAFCDDIQLRHLMADLFGAGVDTTFTTIRWALLYIALYPTVQKRLREELRQRLVVNEPPSLKDVEALPYLRATIAEVQRIRTVVPLGIPHGTTKEIKIGDFKIPSNTMIMPVVWAVHMNPILFNAPNTFKPERFLDLEGRFSIPNYFLPFQVGKRMCLGEELARNILHLYIANIVSHYDWIRISPEDAMLIDLTGNCGLTLTPPDYIIIFSKNNK
ncbi:AGAP004665-PA [Anopheles gambiae str. PEST]|uniref:AGAP004665-PA n=4 Tax=gambiae species complex TaxID=44542 RepID=Q7Q2D4_ANOGA|nr:cytochrome P450 306a1-like isoform X2 [Anopheles coluzzii]XP_049461192.1 cytochrome P450 306a1-like isoform X2 [Anopheles coluzzii]XP_049461193.1 cytochrome P450 306a1-like isoform X2 [Anopheles coluzzii]XP_049461194.1 cytochrome P450 306a1-like isoform X2 [Anopheles coluzzii]EAA13571.4 AGAP004665-PA [Anopheles gambiae str. PEST]